MLRLSPHHARTRPPGVPLLVLTTTPRVASQCALLHGAVPAVLDGGLDMDHDQLLAAVRRQLVKSSSGVSAAADSKAPACGSGYLQQLPGCQPLPSQLLASRPLTAACWNSQAAASCCTNN